MKMLIKLFLIKMISILLIFSVSFSEAGEIASLQELTCRAIQHKANILFGSDKPLELANNTIFQQLVLQMPNIKKWLDRAISIEPLEDFQRNKKVVLSVAKQDNNNLFKIQFLDSQTSYAFIIKNCWCSQSIYPELFRQSTIDRNSFFVFFKREYIHTFLKHYVFDQQGLIKQERTCPVPGEVPLKVIEASNPQRYLIYGNRQKVYLFDFESFTIGAQLFDDVQCIKMNARKNLVALAFTDSVQIFSVDKLDVVLHTIPTTIQSIKAMKFYCSDSILLIGGHGPGSQWGVLSLEKNKEITVEDHSSAVCKFYSSPSSEDQVFMRDGFGKYHSISFPFLMAYELVMQADKEQQTTENSNNILSNAND